MPIYEFFCSDCHTVYSFFTDSPGASSSKVPTCPTGNSAHALTRRPSSFATLRFSGSNGAGEDGLGALSELEDDRLADAFDSIAHEMESMGSTDDPRAMAQALKRFSEKAASSWARACRMP